MYSWIWNNKKITYNISGYVTIWHRQIVALYLGYENGCYFWFWSLFHISLYWSLEISCDLLRGCCLRRRRRRSLKSLQAQLLRVTGGSCTLSLRTITHTAYRTLHTAHCMLQYTQYTAYCTLLTAHRILHTAHCTLHTAHRTQHTAHCTLHTAHCTLHTAQAKKQTTHGLRQNHIYAARNGKWARWRIM